MTDPVTVSEAFVEWLEIEGYGAFGVNIFINRLGLKTPQASFTVITNGGQLVRRLVTGEAVKQYLIQVQYRDVSNKNVDRTLFNLEERLNAKDCFKLTGFEVDQVSTAQFASNQDIDLEELQTGLLTVNVQLYRAPNSAPNIES